MNKFICLLRGINVSGNNKIKMSELAVMFEQLGFGDITTYIQTGNILFACDKGAAEQLQGKIKSAIANTFGFDIVVLVRPVDKLHQVKQALPFANIDVASQGTQVMICFLSEMPCKTLSEAITQWAKPPELLIIEHDVAYLHCPNGYGKSKLSNMFLEKKLQVSATTRNLKTLDKLCQLALI